MRSFFISNLFVCNPSKNPNGNKNLHVSLKFSAYFSLSALGRYSMNSYFFFTKLELIEVKQRRCFDHN
jgi:hypothetical protein